MLYEHSGPWGVSSPMAEAIGVTSLVIHANDHLSSLSAAFDNLQTCQCVVLDGNSNSISLSTLRDCCLVGSHGTMAEQLHCHAATPDNTLDLLRFIYCYPNFLSTWHVTPFDVWHVMTCDTWHTESCDTWHVTSCRKKRKVYTFRL